VLTDIFSRRYDGVVLRSAIEQRDLRLFVQLFRMVEEQLKPYWVNGMVDIEGEAYWSAIQRRLSMELGLISLSPEYYMKTYGAGATTWEKAEKWATVLVCKNWMLKPFDHQESADNYIKDRLSFVELAFRSISETNAVMIEYYSNPQPSEKLEALRSFAADSALSRFKREQTRFTTCVVELNERLRHAGYPLNYHNGYLQFSDDKLIEAEVERHFWNLISDKIWENVDLDMKNSIDIRDSGGRDPAFFAARALESAIKIISSERGWTSGKEKGAYNYLDNLVSVSNGRFIEVWEAEQLKNFFKNVRNPLGHGPGEGKMPSLTVPQTNWAIAFSMIWIRSLISRM
jgi:hypothetical protein